MATPTPITEGGGLSQPYRGKAMNEEKDKPEGEEKDLSETEWEEVSYAKKLLGQHHKVLQ